MKRISADFIYTLEEDKPLENHIITIDDEGKILKIELKTKENNRDVDFYPGLICPGFINAHCHLELSHLLGEIPTGTKLIPFISEVVSKRNFPHDFIQECIKKADDEMWEAGIQAVGDISNTEDTFKSKSESKIIYHTYIELFDLLQAENANSSMEKGWQLKLQAEQLGLSASLAPHAPYSVSEELMSSILTDSERLSIHNQETAAEDLFFQRKEGDFVDFYSTFGLNIDGFKAKRKNSLPAILEDLNSTTPTLFVHNSFTGELDLLEAQNKLHDVFWSTCPNANLYIENRLPDYAMFIRNESRMVVGTDSLSSNWKLSILEELKTIKKYYSAISTFDLLIWACKNGSEALALDKDLGTLSVGKNPGILNITTSKEGEINEQSNVMRLF